VRPFAYERADTVAAAAATVVEELPPTAAPRQFIAGGTTMTDCMKLNVMRPERLVDINGLDRSELGAITVTGAGIRLGALVRMAEAEDDETLRHDYPVIHESLKLAASRQIRVMASLGGNALQRTRCPYFRDVSWPCNKREPGSGCSAMDGFNRQHAVLGTSDACIATYHGDFAQALIALDASVDTVGPMGARRLPFAELHRPPGGSPHIETVLLPGELITAINVPSGPWTARSHYLKIRDRESYEFALASAAVALELHGEVVHEVRIALGGVATVPWRAHSAEEALRGKVLDEATAMAAAEAAFAHAQPRRHNAFKVPLGKQTLVRALLETRAMGPA
jgi:xanthine dehydrogenase YagS FAD-binding subunit